MQSVDDISGHRFDRLAVIKSSGGGNWLCMCDCGNEKVVKGSSLRRGVTRSCGCLRKDVSSIAAKTLSATHGKSGLPEYRIWKAMRGRCQSPAFQNYSRYGGRGIGVCDRWQSFENFYSDMGPRPSSEHSIERIDNDGDYCPENCKWATRKEQANNRRTSRAVTAFGATKTVIEWSRVTGVHPATLVHRLNRGWLPGRALTKGSSSPIRFRVQKFVTAK